MYQSVSGCVGVYQAVSGCVKLCQGVLGCIRVYQGVSGCIRVLPRIQVVQGIWFCSRHQLVIVYQWDRQTNNVPVVVLEYL